MATVEVKSDSEFVVHLNHVEVEVFKKWAECTGKTLGWLVSRIIHWGLNVCTLFDIS